MPINQFSFLQISLAFMLSIGMMNHVIIIPFLMEVSARDSWVSIILTAIIFIPISLMVGYVIYKTKRTQVNEWLSQHYGRWLSVPTTVFVVIILISIIIIISRELATWTNSSYMPYTPPPVIVIVFLAAGFYTALKGFKAVIITSGILLPIVILFGEFVMTANFAYKDYTLLFPVFEYGTMPVWKGIIYIGSGLIELVLLVFLQQHLSKQVKKRYIVIFGLLLAGLTLGPTMGALAAFGPVEASLQRSPAFEQWRLVRIGSYIEHVDFLSIFQWVSGAFIRIALSLYIIYVLLPQKRKKIWLTIITFLCSVAILFPIGDITFFYFLKNYYYPIFFFSMICLISLLFFLALFSKSKKTVKKNEAENQ